MVNDVGGLSSEEMIELAGESGVDFVAMHQLSLPVDPKITLAQDADPYAALEQWLLARLERWEKAGLDLNRIIFDPGIGFGKTVQQNRELLSRAGEFRRHGLRVLIGHSRKSFLGDVVGDEMTARDLATAGLSLNLCQQGVDILRVHNVPINIGIYRGWALASAGKGQAPTAGGTRSQSGL
jgi:dihydropteroate synthase